MPALPCGARARDNECRRRTRARVSPLMSIVVVVVVGSVVRSFGPGRGFDCVISKLQNDEMTNSMPFTIGLTGSPAAAPPAIRRPAKPPLRSRARALSIYLFLSLSLSLAPILSLPPLSSPLSLSLSYLAPSCAGHCRLWQHQRMETERMHGSRDGAYRRLLLAAANPAAAAVAASRSAITLLMLRGGEQSTAHNAPQACTMLARRHSRTRLAHIGS